MKIVVILTSQILNLLLSLKWYKFKIFWIQETEYLVTYLKSLTLCNKEKTERYCNVSNWKQLVWRNLGPKVSQNLINECGISNGGELKGVARRAHFSTNL